MASSPIGRWQIEDSAGVGFDTSRGRSAVLWENSLDIYDPNRTLGTLRSDDFTQNRVNTVGNLNENWFLSEVGVAAATSEAFNSLVDVAGTVGVASLAATTGLAQRGAQVTRGLTATYAAGNLMTLYNHATLGRGKVFSEVRVNVDDTEAFFIGHSEPADVLVLTILSAMSVDRDYIGFHRLAEDGDVSFVCADGGTGGTSHSVVVATATEVRTGYNKFGWSVDTDGKVIITVNGEYRETASLNVPIDTLPLVGLTQRLAITNGLPNTATVSLDIDWFDEYTSDAR